RWCSRERTGVVMITPHLWIASVAADSAKFPVKFPVSKEIWCRDGFAADCILRVAGLELACAQFWKSPDGLKKFPRHQILKLYGRKPRQHSWCSRGCSAPLLRVGLCGSARRSRGGECCRSRGA